MAVWRKLLLGLCVGLIPLLSLSTAAAGDIDEQKLNKLKAAYLYNLLKFTHWPEAKFEDKDTPIRVIILGQTPVAQVFENAVKDRTAQDRPITTERVRCPHEPSQAQSGEEHQRELQAIYQRLRTAHMIFFSNGTDPCWPQLEKALEGSHTLRVSDLARFAETGGMVELALKDKKRLGFVVNLEAVQDEGLRLSSSLLKLAEVIDGPQASVDDGTDGGPRPQGDAHIRQHARRNDHGGHAL